MDRSTTKIKPPSFDRSSQFDENRLDFRGNVFPGVYGYLYDVSNLLEPTEPSIRNCGLSVYRWSIQLCNGSDAMEIERKVDEALRSLESVYVFDRKPSSKVFGKYGEVVFDTTYPPTFTRECRDEDINPELMPRLEGRVVNLRVHLENDKAGVVRALPGLVTIMPPDYQYHPN